MPHNTSVGSGWQQMVADMVGDTSHNPPTLSLHSCSLAARAAAPAACMTRMRGNPTGPQPASHQLHHCPVILRPPPECAMRPKCEGLFRRPPGLGRGFQAEMPNPVATRLPGRCYPRRPWEPLSRPPLAEFLPIQRAKAAVFNEVHVQPRCSLQLVQYGRLHPVEMLAI